MDGSTVPPAPAVVSTPPTTPPRISLFSLGRLFLFIGVTGFGGGLPVYIRLEVVDKKHWLDEEDVIEGMEIANILPGSNVSNLAVYVGQRLRGIPGAAVALAGLLLPGAVMVLFLGALYFSNASLPDVQAVLRAVGAAAVGLILVNAIQIGRKELTGWIEPILVTASFGLVALFGVQMVIVLVVFGAIGIWLRRPSELKRAASEGQR